MCAPLGIPTPQTIPPGWFLLQLFKEPSLSSCTLASRGSPTYTLLVRFLIGLAIIAVGFLMVWKTAWFLDIFGRVPWAERNFTTSFGAGMGGSWMWYKLLGVTTIVAALLYMTGILQTMLVRILGPFFGGAS